MHVDEATVCAVPPQWTDVVAPDPEIVIGAHQALFRMGDLLELARLVEQLSKRETRETAEEGVKGIPPQVLRKRRRT